MSRVCRRCKVEKDDSQFGKLRCSKDGINPRCRQCCCESVKRSKKSPEAIAKKKVYVAEWQRENSKKRNEQSREWYKRNLEKAREMSLEATRKYYSTDSGKEKRQQRSKKWEIENRDKRLAQGKLKDHVRRGKIKRPDVCSQCLVKCKPHGHHEDYARPLDVIWICAKCHLYLHHSSKFHRERTSEKTPKGDAMFRPLEETERDTQK